VRATIVVIVTSIWEMFRRTGCPDDRAAADFEAFAKLGQGAWVCRGLPSLALGVAVLEVGNRVSGFQVSRPNAYHQGVDAIISFEQRDVGPFIWPLSRPSKAE
jgi:hypothetical protein